MTLFVEAFAWIVANLGPAGEGELWTRLGEHVLYTLVSVVIAAAIAIPAGYLIGHTGRGREIAVAISGAALLAAPTPSSAWRWPERSPTCRCTPARATSSPTCAPTRGAGTAAPGSSGCSAPSPAAKPKKD